ncbi:MAG: biotin--[acetyl-CoA-carboxylase] ligase [Bacteroidales bacterium]|nr:biotin--[acetyl-CoA-carboxylase] ligase [Bacteroidales bacterium]
MVSHKNIIHLKEIDSTNKFAREMEGIDEIADGTIIWADNQISGKGRGRNVWISEDGRNLTFSNIFHPVFLPVDFHFYLSKMVSLAVVDFLAKYVKNVKIKWPNDIYVHDEKIAGILIENKIMLNMIKNSIIGIGINVNQDFSNLNLPNPVSLKQLTGSEFDIAHLLDEVIYCLDNRYSQLKEKDYQGLDKDYSMFLYKKDQICGFVKYGESFNAIIKGVTEDGLLNVYTEGGESKLLDFGEVAYAL